MFKSISFYVLVAGAGMVQAADSPFDLPYASLGSLATVYNNTYSMSNTNNGVGAFREFGFSFTAAAFASKTGSGTAADAPYKVGEKNVFADMHSITIKGASGGTGTSGTFYLLVYEGKDKPSALSDLVGVSTNAVSYTVGNTSSLTFNFSDLLLDTQKQYSFVFSTSSTAQAGLAGNNQGVRMNYTDSAAGAWVQGGSNTSTPLSDSRSLVGMSMNFDTVYIPEPSLASLGLLGFGLMAFRRRRS